MRVLKNTTSRTLYALRALGPSAFLRLLFSMCFSVNHYYLLGKHLSAAEERATGPAAAIPARVTAQDLAALWRMVDRLDPTDKREVLSRLFFYEDGFENCYATKRGEEIVYLQWVIFPSENPIIERSYRSKFYPLAERQVMVENAFTFPEHRGKGYLIHGTGHLLQLAREQGYSAAICYIRKDRIASLNEFFKMGFRIVKILTEYKVLGLAWRTL